MTKPKLISFKLCPFVQRAAIVLQYKAIEHDIEYIDLANPPAWFPELSPLKKVPVLVVDGHVIFESAVINEFLDEAYPKRLHPDDIYLRAMNRSWIEFGNECMLNTFQLSVKESEREFIEVRDGLLNKFDQLEKVVHATPFFNGPALSLVDAAYAPMLQRLGFLDELCAGMLDAKRHPKINHWKDQLLALDAVRKSHVPELKELYHAQLAKRKGYVARFVDPGDSRQVGTKSLH